jgi:hypothetical protein
MAKIFTYRKRQVTTDDVQFVRNLIAKQPTIGRCELSRQVCRAWNWVQPNGYLKDIICRGLMLKLDREGHLTLPPRKFTPNNPLAQRKPPEKISVSQDPVHTKIKELYPVILCQVRRSTDEKLFNSLIQQFHYLGYTQPVGEHLKYLITALDRPIACLTFSSAPRHLGPRDRFIGWSAQARRSNIRFLAYNCRFLILPWVKVKFFASHLLGRISRQISDDWQRQYGHPVYYLETFVDPSLFAGTCYRAANWEYLGLTTGRGKDDLTMKQNRTLKEVLGYPLTRKFRELLGCVN